MEKTLADVLADHWLLMDSDRRITGCQCGYRADPGDEGYGDSVVAHIASTALEAETHG